MNPLHFISTYKPTLGFEGMIFISLIYSHLVPINFSKGSPSFKCVSQNVPNSTTLLSNSLWLKLNFHIYTI